MLDETPAYASFSLNKGYPLHLMIRDMTDTPAAVNSFRKGIAAHVQFFGQRLHGQVWVEKTLFVFHYLPGSANISSSPKAANERQPPDFRMIYFYCFFAVKIGRVISYLAKFC